MSIIKKNISKKTWAKLIAILVGVLLVLGYVIWDIAADGPITSFLGNRDTVVKAVQDMGVFGPLLYIVLQIAQIILAPIPGQVVGGVGGYLFGWWGILWSLIGGTLGYIIVILLARKFGRPLLEKFFKKDAIAKFDFALGDNASVILFLIFLLPGLPDDMVGYMAGLTNVPFGKLLLLITAGRLPSIVVMNYVGMGLGEENLAPVIIISVIVVLLLGLAIWKKDKIMQFLKNRNHHKSDSDSETK